MPWKLIFGKIVEKKGKKGWKRARVI